MPDAGQFRKPALGGGKVGKGADHEPVAVVVLAPEFEGVLIFVHSVSPIGADAQAGPFFIDPHSNGAVIEEGEAPVEVASEGWTADFAEGTVRSTEQFVCVAYAEIYTAAW